MKTSSILLRPLLFLNIFLAFVLFSCEKEGDPGPQGLRGEQGTEGPQGEKGDPGTADVIYSEWTFFDTNNWRKVTEFGRETQLYPVEDTLITQEIIDQGLIMVYIRFGGTPQPRPLPYTGYVTSSSKDQSIWYRLFPETIEIVFNNLGENTDPGTFGAGNFYRYIIVPGGTAINGRFSQTFPNISYNETCILYDIPL